jgi:hypothetical protein
LSLRKAQLLPEPPVEFRFRSKSAPAFVNVTSPVALRVPVTATPVLVTATTVFTPESNERFPLESAVVTTPPPDVVIAAIVEAIYIS